MKKNSCILAYLIETYVTKVKQINIFLNMYLNFRLKVEQVKKAVMLTMLPFQLMFSWKKLKVLKSNYL